MQSISRLNHQLDLRMRSCEFPIVSKYPPYHYFKSSHPIWNCSHPTRRKGPFGLTFFFTFKFNFYFTFTFHFPQMRISQGSLEQLAPYFFSSIKLLHVLCKICFTPPPHNRPSSGKRTCSLEPQNHLITLSLNETLPADSTLRKV